MQFTIPSSLPSQRQKHFLPSRGILTLIFVLLGFSASFATEPLLTLAMVRTDSRMERRIPVPVKREYFSAPLPTSKSLSAMTGRLSAPSIRPDSLSLPPVSLLEKSSAGEIRNPLKLTRREAEKNADARLWASASVQAGYGEVYYDKNPRIYGHNGTGWEEPSCGYVKVHFRF